MQTEIIIQRDDLLIRRLILEPGEAMPWHTDPCQRSTVVLRGEQLHIEFHDSEDRIAVEVHPGMVDWDEPQARVHRGVNTGATTYEEVVTFFIDPPGIDPQPPQR